MCNNNGTDTRICEKNKTKTIIKTNTVLKEEINNTANYKNHSLPVNGSRLFCQHLRYISCTVYSNGHQQPTNIYKLRLLFKVL